MITGSTRYCASMYTNLVPRDFPGLAAATGAMRQPSHNRARQANVVFAVFPDGNSFATFLHKRPCFEHELRAIMQPISPGGDRPLAETEPFADGLLVSVDLHL